jgi:hypothetical protein
MDAQEEHDLEQRLHPPVPNGPVLRALLVKIRREKSEKLKNDDNIDALSK